jgi:Na+(H+)/acetate symporter ActP
MSIGSIDPWIFAFSSVTVIVTIWMGFRSAKTSKTASDFFVAGRSVSVGWNASAISGEYLSAASFMGVAGMVMSSGYDALWYPVCYACGYLFLLLFIAGPLRRFGAYTIPDFAEGRFDSPLFRKIAVVFVLFIGFFYTMPQMKGAGTTLAYIFPGLPYWAGVVLVGAVITLNVALGGMKGITLVQAFQYWAKMFAISVPIFVLMAVYGDYGRQIGSNGGKSAAPNTNSFILFTNFTSQPLSTAQEIKLAANNLGKGFRWERPVPSDISDELRTYAEFIGGHVLMSSNLAGTKLPAFTNETPYRPMLTKMLRQILATNGIAVIEAEDGRHWVVPQQDDGAVRSMLAATGVRQWNIPDNAPKDQTWLNPFGPLTTKAAKAAKLSPEESKPYSLLYTYSLIIALVCGTAGLPHILVRFYTNPDGVAAKRTTMWVMILIGIFYIFPPIFGVLGRNLLPELYSGIGAKGTDKIVLELPRILNQRYGVLGSILSGITCAGAFAAFMSTFSGLLVSMTGAMAHDVYGRMLNPKATPNQRLRAFKIAAVAIGAVAIVLGMQVEPLEINFMVGQAFAIAAASYFPLLFMAVWWRGLTMKGAATGMLTGGLSALIGISLTSFSTLAISPGKTGEMFAVFKPLNGFWAAHPLLRIICEQPAIWAVPLALFLMVLVSKLTRRDVPEDIRMKMLVLHAPEKLGLKQEYIQEHQAYGH